MTPRNFAKIPLLGLLLAIHLVVGCGSGDTSTGPTGGVTSSGVQGQVTRGPLSPVVQNGVTNSAPLANAVITVRGLDGQEVGRASSDGSGNYRIGVSPGNYQVVGLAPNGNQFPAPPAPLNVTVTANQFSTVNLEFDTGIR